MKHEKFDTQSESRQAAAEGILEAVENQLKANNPPQAKKALNRLISQGESRDNAIRHIASALMIEVFDVVTNEAQYNEARYIRNLNGLPQQPSESA